MKFTYHGLLLVTLFSVGCAVVPKESIELSATVGRDLEMIHKANRNLAVMHFDYLLADVDRFVDEVYRPFMIEATADSLRLVDEFKAALAGTHAEDLDGLDVLIDFSEELSAKIDSFRAEMRAPLEAQRDSVLFSIDEAFQQVQTANAVVTGHLASVRKVHDTQSEILGKIGLEDYRSRVAGGLSDLSNNVGGLLKKARSVNEKLKSEEDSTGMRELFDALPADIRQFAEGTSDTNTGATDDE